MTNRMKKLIGALVVGVGVPWAAQAALIVYTTQASFLAAVSNAATDTFNDLAIQLQASPLNRTVGGYGYQASIANGIFPAGTVADVWLAGNTATDTITFGTFSGGVSAIGGYFFNTSILGVLQTGRAVTVAANDGSGPVSQVLSSTTATTFLGFVSDGLITSLTVDADNTGITSGIPATWPTVNDLILAQRLQGEPPGPSVPEPGVLALLGLAAAGMSLMRRRRR